jgi:hypothetical protein
LVLELIGGEELFERLALSHHFGEIQVVQFAMMPVYGDYHISEIFIITYTKGEGSHESTLQLLNAPSRNWCHPS